MKLSEFKTIVFDCDGVILDSNSVKREAFRSAASRWGAEAAEALVAHHIANGGVSRYAKLTYFLEVIVPSVVAVGRGPGLEEMLGDFASAAQRGLITCSVTPGLRQLRAQVPACRWLVVSGGDQAELRSVFTERGLAGLFDGGIFGSPDEKKSILERELDKGNILAPAVYLGDSKYDYQCAVDTGLDFVFVSGWSEVKDWQEFASSNNLKTVSNVSDLIS